MVKRASGSSLPTTATSNGETNKDVKPRSSLPAIPSPPIAAEESGYNPASTPILFNPEDELILQRMHSNFAESILEPVRVKPVQKKRRRHNRSGFVGFITRVAVVYLAYAYCIACPNDPTYAVCHQLDNFSAILVSYEPVAQPYIESVARRLEPFQPYVEIVKPYYLKSKPLVGKVREAVGPYLEKLVEGYNVHAYPLILKGIKSSQEATKPYVNLAKQQYSSTIEPTVEWYSHEGLKWYSKVIEPTTNQIIRTVRDFYDKSEKFAAPICSKYHPLVQRYLYETMLPRLASSLSTIKSTYVTSIHPRLKDCTASLYSGYRTSLVPSFNRFWSVYVEPQLDKVRARIFEYETLETGSLAKEKVAVEVKTEDKAKEESLEPVEVEGEDAADDLDAFIAELREIKSESASTAEPIFTALPVDPAEDAAAQLTITAAKRLALEALQRTYEKEIAALGQAQFRSLSEEIIALRSSSVIDIPIRFDSVLEQVEEEGDRLIGKLSKYFTKKISPKSMRNRLTIEERIKDIQVLKVNAMKKMKKERADASDAVNEYKKAMEVREEASVQVAGQKLSQLVSKAQEELGFGWTWLDDVTHQDWQRFHKIAKVESQFAANYASLIVDQELSHTLLPLKLLDQVIVDVDLLVNAFEEDLDKLLERGQQDLRDEDGMKSVEIIEGAQKQTYSQLLAAAKQQKREEEAIVLESPLTPAPSVEGILAPSTGNEIDNEIPEDAVISNSFEAVEVQGEASSDLPSHSEVVGSVVEANLPLESDNVHSDNVDNFGEIDHLVASELEDFLAQPVDTVISAVNAINDARWTEDGVEQVVGGNAGEAVGQTDSASTTDNVTGEKINVAEEVITRADDSTVAEAAAVVDELAMAGVGREEEKNSISPADIDEPSEMASKDAVIAAEMVDGQRRDEL